MESRIETLLNALINGETIDFAPQSRMEEYLKNCINKAGTEGLPSPQSRVDALLYRLAEVVAAAGGGKLQEKTITENGEYVPDEGFDGMSKVTVAVPAPEGDTLTEFLRVRNGEDLFSYSGSVPNAVVSDIHASLEMIPVGVLTNCTRMFYGTNGSLTTIPWFDTSNVIYTDNMFASCSALQTIPLLNTSKVTIMSYMFSSCSSLKSVPLFDTSKVTNMSYMFKDCSSLTSVPLFNTGKVTTMNYMFYNCKKLTDVPLFDTSNVTNMGYMFRSCESLTEVPLLNTSNVTNMTYMFSSCDALTTVPLFDTRKVMNITSMFDSCDALTVIPALDFRGVTAPSSAFNGLKNITEIWIKNIGAGLTLSNGTTYGNLLTVDSLVHLCYELRDIGASRTLTIGSANLEKLANVYVKLVDITDAMRAEDDLIDKKLPFVVCDSTDEGATLISDYVSFKNWALK